MSLQTGECLAHFAINQQHWNGLLLELKCLASFGNHLTAPVTPWQTDMVECVCRSLGGELHLPVNRPFAGPGHVTYPPLH